MLRLKRAHAVAYELCHGPVPAGLVLDHFACQTPRCCNPEHVEPVTSKENTRRGRSLRYVDGRCPRCGSTRLYARKWGHACADCRKAYEQTPARAAKRAAYEAARAQTPERREQHRQASARYHAKKRLTSTSGVAP